MPKEEEIRMVHNRTLSGLEGTIWATNSSLLAVASTLIAVEGGTYMAVRYIGEMF